MMRRAVLLSAFTAVTVSLSGLAAAEDLSTLSDLDLLAKTREAVALQDADLVLELMTEMQGRGVGLFAGSERAVCEEVIVLPDGVTDWRFKGAARQAYITAAKERQFSMGDCGCMFGEYTFEEFTIDVLGKSSSDLNDTDRAALETYLSAEQRDVESQHRNHEKSCRAN
jgi:hypothetical protein